MSLPQDSGIATLLFENPFGEREHIKVNVSRSLLRAQRGNPTRNDECTINFAYLLIVSN